MTDAGPVAFTAEGECWARKKASVAIGSPTHTHVCREPVDEEALHPGKHQCTCSAQW